MNSHGWKRAENVPNRATDDVKDRNAEEGAGESFGASKSNLANQEGTKEQADGLNGPWYQEAWSVCALAVI